MKRLKNADTRGTDHRDSRRFCPDRKRRGGQCHGYFNGHLHFRLERTDRSGIGVLSMGFLREKPAQMHDLVFPLFYGTRDQTSAKLVCLIYLGKAGKGEC